MKHLKLRALVITALALGASHASFAFFYSGCKWPCDPPTPRNGWKPASIAKAMPQTAAAQDASEGALKKPSNASPARTAVPFPKATVPGASQTVRLNTAKDQ